MPTAADICPDLTAEQDDLEALLVDLGDEQWRASTPAAGWTVQDSVAHIVYFDETAAVAAADPDRFEALVAELRRRRAAGDPPDVALSRAADPPALLARWRSARRNFIEAVTAADPKSRVPWFGLSMSPTSMATARLMETWAHGADVRDGLGVPLVPSGRLRHVCDLGYRARRFAFTSHRIEDPGDPVRLVVTGPGGDQWTWGPPDAPATITGPALDVALVFTQRRHPSHTGVEASGRAAGLWLTVAQAFAGPGTRVDPDR